MLHERRAPVRHAIGEIAGGSTIGGGLTGGTSVGGLISGGGSGSVIGGGPGMGFGFGCGIGVGSGFGVMCINDRSRVDALHNRLGDSATRRETTEKGHDAPFLIGG
jgi:hypothetical protein